MSIAPCPSAAPRPKTNEWPSGCSILRPDEQKPQAGNPSGGPEEIELEPPPTAIGQREPSTSRRYQLEVETENGDTVKTGDRIDPGEIKIDDDLFEHRPIPGEEEVEKLVTTIRELGQDREVDVELRGCELHLLRGRSTVFACRKLGERIQVIVHPEMKSDFDRHLLALRLHQIYRSENRRTAKERKETAKDLAVLLYEKTVKELGPGIYPSARMIGEDVDVDLSRQVITPILKMMIKKNGDDPLKVRYLTPHGQTRPHPMHNSENRKRGACPGGDEAGPPPDAGSKSEQEADDLISPAEAWDKVNKGLKLLVDLVPDDIRKGAERGEDRNECASFRAGKNWILAGSSALCTHAGHPITD